MKGFNMKTAIYTEFFANHNKSSIKGFARKHGVSKNTVKKYKNELEAIINSSNASELNYNVSVWLNNTSMDVSNRKSYKLSNQMIGYIDKCIQSNIADSAAGRSKMKMKNEDIYQGLIDNYDYSGSYELVCYHIKKYRHSTKEAFIRLEHKPGAKAEFDWGEVVLNIPNYDVKFKLGIFCFPYSNTRFAYLYPNENGDSFADAHLHLYNETHAFASKMVYDNASVQRKNRKDIKDTTPTDLLVGMSEHYNYNVEFCNFYSGNEKGSVERSVEVIRSKVFGARRDFDSLEEARDWLANKMITINKKYARDFETELQHMEPVKYPYIHSYARTYKVTKYATICIKTNHYSVPDSFVSKDVETIISYDNITIMSNNKTIANHKRLHGKNQWSIEVMHHLKTLSRKPRAITESYAVSHMNESYTFILEHYYQSEPKEFILLLMDESIQALHPDDLIEAVEYCKTQMHSCIHTVVQEYVKGSSNDNSILFQMNTNLSKYDELAVN